MSAPFLFFVVLLLGTGIMRLVELLVSMRRMAAKPAAVIKEDWLFPLMALLHFGLVFAPIAEAYWLQRPFLVSLGTGAIAVLVGATILRVWTLRTIGAAWNVRVVAPDESLIVSSGPYAFIRHPNYLVVILEIAALPLVHTAWISAMLLTLLNAFVLFHRIRTEEKMLDAIPAWHAAFADKARLIPGIL